MGHHQAIPGWDYLGDTKDNLWGKFVPQGTFRPMATPIAHQPPPTPQREQSPQDWDKYYKQIQATRPNLIPEDHQDLSQRLQKAGLDPAHHIPQLGAISMSRGYTIPIPDHQGLLVGAQVRIRGEVEGGRYRWDGVPDGIDRHINSELPLAVWPGGGGDCPVDALIVEGTGIKPYIAAQILGVVAIGAAGGNHASSPQALNNALGDSKVVGIVPDGGAVLNSHVLGRYRAAQDLLESLGRSVLFAWWGQSTKADGDIDEGIDLQNIQWLSPQQFWAMADPKVLPKPQPQRRQIPPVPFRYPQLPPVAVTGAGDGFSIVADARTVYTLETFGCLVSALPYVASVEFTGEWGWGYCNNLKDELWEALVGHGVVIPQTLPGESIEALATAVEGICPEVWVGTQPLDQWRIRWHTPWLSVIDDGPRFCIPFRRPWGWKCEAGLDPVISELVAGREVSIPEGLPDRATSSLGKHLRLSGADVWVGAEPLWQWHRRRAYEESQAYTPDLLVDSRFNLPLTPDRDLCLRAGIGTGKTTVIGNACVQWQDDNFALLDPKIRKTQRIILIGSRIRLGQQTSERISESFADALEMVVLDKQTLPDGTEIYQRVQNPTKMIHQQHREFTTTLQDPKGAAALVIDSIGKAAKCWKPLFTGALVIIDECQGVYEHLHTASTLKRNRGIVYKTLEEILPASGCVILADAMASDVVVGYFAGLTGRTFQKIHNRYQSIPSNFTFLQTHDVKGGSTDSSGLINLLDTALAAGENLVFCTDSRITGELLDQRLGGQYKVLRIDIKTVKHWAALISSPTMGAMLVAMGINLLIYSPTLVNGIDICGTGDYFSQGFGYFMGITSTQQEVQQLGRVRDVKTWTVAVPEYTTIAAPDDRPHWNQTEAKQEQLMHEIGSMIVLYGKDSEIVQTALEEVMKSPHLQSVAGLELERGYQRSNTRACLMDLLESQGHTVTLAGVHAKEPLKKEIKGIKEALIDRDSAAIFDSPEIDVIQARGYLNNPQASEEQIAAAQRALLIDRLPGITETELWDVDLVKRIYFKERGLLTKLTNWILINNPEVALDRGVAEVRAIVCGPGWLGDVKPLNAKRGSGWLGDVKPLNAKLGLIRDSGMLALVGQSGISATSPEVKAIARYLKKSKVAGDLNVNPGKDPLRRINRILSDTLAIEISSSRAGEGKKRRYSYSPPESESILLGCLETRILNGGQKRPQTLTGQGVQEIHLPPTISKKKKGASGSGKRPKNTPKTKYPDAIWQWVREGISLEEALTPTPFLDLCAPRTSSPPAPPPPAAIAPTPTPEAA